MNVRISILPDDKCYLLSEGLVNSFLSESLAHGKL